MRIAYIAPYQGKDLIQKRPCLYNLSLAARVKIQLIAEMLQEGGHEVEILSQGALEPLVGAARFRPKFYGAFEESERFHPRIPIYYVSALAVKFLTGIWESTQAQQLLARRHAADPFDVVILYNLQRGQIGCAKYAKERLGVPVILQYEDDAFVDVHGRAWTGFRSGLQRKACRRTLGLVSAGTGVTHYLLNQMPPNVPKLLLRGIVSKEILKRAYEPKSAKKNWVAFSGTHEGTQGLEQMVKAWRMLKPQGWQLHIAGQGPITQVLKQLAEGDASITFHGLLNREENARLLCASKIGLNPQDLTKTPGNVFPFKIVEYLAAGTHVISTPRGPLEPELEAGVTYIRDNDPELISAALGEVIGNRLFEQTAEHAAIETYGPSAIARSLQSLIDQVTNNGKNVGTRADRDVSVPVAAR